MSSSSPSPIIVQFEAGELIFSTGDPGEQAYIIEAGQIEIFIDPGAQPLSLRQLGPGDVLGEMAVIDAAPRSASARALVPTRCLVISSQQISERIDESDPVVRLLITTLLDRMRSLTHRPRLNRSSADYSEGDHSSMLSASSPPPTVAPQEPNEQTVIDKIRLESELRTAIASDKLIPHYQPLVDLQTQQIVGFELLVRWHSPSRGPVSPGLFISIAEETSLIIPVGCWALQAAVQAVQTFQDHTNRVLFISVNISAKQFLAPDFIEQLAHLVPSEYISNIKLEVTESILMAGDQARQTLHICREMGFHISLDDFGTGFSSLSYLSDLEVDSIKIDQAFVRKMLAHHRTFVLTKTMLAMTHDLGMVSIAEGIETAEQQDVLKSLGCHIGQGYLYSPPIKLSEALTQLTDA